MTKPIFAALAASFLATGCQHFAPFGAATEDAQLADTSAIATFASDAVYAAHPTRALVDNIDIVPAAELGRYMVLVEMTGAPESRDVFDLVVFENAEGALELVSLEQVQGN